MKFKIILFCTLLLFTFGHAQEVTDPDMSPAPSEIYFNYMMIYSYEKTVHGVKEKKEFEFYFNPETQFLMWLPRFEMVNAVISTSKGEIYSFSESLHDGKQAYVTTFNPESATAYESVHQLEVLKNKKLRTDAFALNLSQFRLTYKIGGDESLISAANNFPLKNAYQLYALTQLADFDAHLPFSFDFTHILTKNEFLVSAHTTGPWGNEKIELYEITSTMYYFETAPYSFFTTSQDGFKEIENPFKNQKHPDYFK